MGARAETAGGTVFLGNRLLMDTQKLALGRLEAEATRLQGDGRTVVHVSQAARVIGLIAIADAIRPTSKAAVAKLRERNIEVVMLTGDNAATAKRIAADLGIENVLADVLPAKKAEKVKELQATGKKVGMVGGGLQRDRVPACCARLVPIRTESGGRCTVNVRQYPHRGDQCADAEAHQARRHQKCAITQCTGSRRSGFIGSHAMRDPMHTASEAVGRDGRIIGVS